ncbi:MAG: anaerobic ribonucleoside-triphosphate reductase [Eubacteriales bacterium]|nr:anaerobic ribonucleoside-triphosphate reductase [Eubacteriales bacterium]
MITRVIKRDGREVVFNIEKIASAIHKALDASTETNIKDPAQPRSQTSLELATLVAERIDQMGQRCPTIERIQDTVEQVLMETGFPETAKRYILYRSQRTHVREMKTHLMQAFHAMNPLATPAQGTSAAGKSPMMNQIPQTASDQLLKYGRTGACSYNLLYVLSPAVSQAHQNLDLFIHQLESYALTYADQPIDLRPLFSGGFRSGQASIRQPSDIRSYAALAGVATASIRQEISGSVYLLHFDRAMADGVRATRQRLGTRFGNWLPPEQAGALADEDTALATYQAMDAVLNQFKTQCFQSQSGESQTCVLFGLETDPESRLVTGKLLEAAGKVAGENPANSPLRKQPRLIYRLAAGVNLQPGDPNHDLFLLACQCCAQTGQPEFAFADPPTTNLATVTINLPRCAILARNDLNLFYQRLEHLLSLAIDSLLERYKTLQSLGCGNFPFLHGQPLPAADPAQADATTLASQLGKGSLAIGLTGLAETLVSLVGRHHGQSREAKDLGLEIVRMMQQTCTAASDRTGILFLLLADSDPLVARSFAESDRRQYGQIAGVTSHPAYTPGFSLPCRPILENEDRIRLESPYHQLVDAGRVLRVCRSTDAATSPGSIAAFVLQAAGSGVGQIIFDSLGD